jgi:predicted 2-oxoglutarate/Fe(II)-dependent dioxygenase YbiX
MFGDYKKGFKRHSGSDIDDMVAITSKVRMVFSKGRAYFYTIAPQRKLTTVLFTTSHSKHIEDPYHFSGGELLFNYLFDKDGNTIKFEPKAGDMIIFPSNPYFSHEVLRVQQGYRLTLVQWHDAIIL